MEIKDIEKQREIFDRYTEEYVKNTTDEESIGRYRDKQTHSVFVQDEAMLVDALFTKYNASFKNLLALESLFHDIGRFEQLKVTGTFEDTKLAPFYPGMQDHGDLGAVLIDEHGLLAELIPDVRTYDEEVMQVIKLHSKVNPGILDGIMREYIDAFKNYDLHDLFLSSKADKEKDVLTRVNTAIIQDVDRLDIFRKIVRGLWTPMTTDEEIDPELFELFKQGKLPTMQQIKEMGKWNRNVGHLVRMSFINQMNLVPVLERVRAENLIDRVYAESGNDIVRPAYDIAKEQIDKMIASSEDGVLVGKKR